MFIANEEGRDARHDRAADAHDADTKRHDRAAWYWSAEGDAHKAALAVRDACLDRDLAEVDRDRARLERARAAGRGPAISISDSLGFPSRP
jgi:hypothetical protein